MGLMTLAAFVAYLMARRLVAWPWALVAGVLTLALPFFVYSTALMTENAFFPVFVLGMLALMLALEKPTLIRQALVVFAVVVAFATRVQGFALAGIVLTSVLLCAMYAGAASSPAAAYEPLQTRWRGSSSGSSSRRPPPSSTSWPSLRRATHSAAPSAHTA